MTDADALARVRAEVERLYPDDEGRGSAVHNQSRVHRRAMLAILDSVAASIAPADPTSDITLFHGQLDEEHCCNAPSHMSAGYLAALPSDRPGSEEREP